MNRAEKFYSKAGRFKKTSTLEVTVKEWDDLFGIADIRLKINTMALGKEYIELMEFLTPKGRPVPLDSKSNDRWFLHIAIVVSDMEKAYARLR